MKSKNSKVARLVPLFFTISLASLHATVSVVGVDATAGANWRTGAALEADSQYGTLGYVVFGLNAPDATYVANTFNIASSNAQNAYSLPAGIGITGNFTTMSMWSGNGNFGTLQDPGASNAITNAPVLANLTGTNKFTLTRATSAAYRLTLLTASGDGEGTTYSPTVNDGSGAVGTSYKHTANGVAYHVFQVSEGTSDIVITLTGTTRSLTGIAFDAFVVPVPLVWVGATSAWDTTTAGNWKKIADGSAALFANSPAHSALFDDNAISTTVDIAPANVTPASVEFNNSAKNFTLQGSNAVAGSASLTKNGTGTLTILNSNTYTGATAINGGSLILGGAGLLGGGTYAGMIANNGTLKFESSANQTFSGVISGTGALTQNSAGMLTLAVANTYTGITTVNGGTLKFSATGTTPVANSLIVNNTGTLTFGRNDTWGQANTLSSAAITVNSGGTLASGGFFNTLWNVALNGGLLLANGGVNATYPAFQLGGTLTATGTSQFNVSLGVNNMINVGAQGNAALTISTPAVADSLTINTVLQNSQVTGASQPGALVKSGPGTLTLTAANTYTGATTVNGGTLNLTGSLGTSVNAVTVNDTATLTATGTINRPVTIASGGTLTPAGAAIGTLAIGNTLTLGGKLICQIDKTGGTLTQDLLDTNSVVYGGTLEVVATGDALALGDAFKLFNSTGTYSGAFGSATLPNLPVGLNWDLSGLTVNGTIAVVNTAAPPVFNPSTGGYVGAQAVTMTSTPGTTIRYTMDGSDPKTSGTVISGASPLVANVPTDTATVTLTAYASQTGYGDSATVSATYSTITIPAWNVDDNGSWSEGAKWKHGVIPDAVGVTADFNSFAQSADANITLDSNRTVGSLIFGNTNPIAWTVSAASGSVLTLATASGSPVINVVGQTATINPAMAGTQGFTKAGLGTLRLTSPASDYTGDVTVAAGTLLAAGSTGGINPVRGSLGNPGVAHTVTVNTGATLSFGNNDLFGNHSSTINVAMVINAGGSVVNNGNFFNALGALTLNGGTLNAIGGANATFPSFAFKGPVTAATGVTSTISAGGVNAAYHLGDGTVTGATFEVQGTGILDITGILRNGLAAAVQPSFLTKTGTGTLTLGGVNTYTGNTTVNAGTLALSDGAQLRFVIGATSGANNQLAGSGTVVLDGDFAIDTTAAAALTTGSWTLEDVTTLTGAYGATFTVVNPDGSPWTNAGGDKWTKSAGAGNVWTFNETTGILTLGAAVGYESWAFENGVTGGPNGDSDNDGIPNLVEYAVNLNPAGSDGGAGTFTGGLLSFAKRAVAVTNGDVTYTIQESDDLGLTDPWAAVTPTTNTDVTISYALPEGSPKKFARLVITQLP